MLFDGGVIVAIALLSVQSVLAAPTISAIPTGSYSYAPTASYSRPPVGSYSQPPQGSYSRPPVGSYTPAPVGSYSRPPVGSYSQPPQGSYSRPPVGSYTPAPVGSYSRPPVGSYSQPPVGSYSRPPVGSYSQTVSGSYYSGRPANSTSSTSAYVPKIAPTASIDAGIVVGTQTSLPGAPQPVNKFLAVPFAASPIRFSPPVRPTPWKTPYEAKQVGPACIQQFNYPSYVRDFTMQAFNSPAPAESEDCLNVNVFAPATQSADGKLRPVMFWLYGGALEFGWNGNPAYDGTSLAANQDVIVVAANYRTNLFGFPSSPDLPLDQRNLGFLDQRLALDWVQRNIRAFGGDPYKVTIFGESAGAASVDELVTSFSENPPFRAAIMESGQSSFYINVDNSPRSWETLVSALNCNTTDTLTCARSVPASVLKVIAEVHALQFRPVADNVTSLRSPGAARKAGNIARVPIMTGTNANEGTVFTLAQTNTTASLLASFPFLSGLLATILPAYPIGSTGIPDQPAQLAAIYTDFVFHCPAAFLAEASSQAGIPTWRYFYDAKFSNIQIVPGVDIGVYHSSEITLVFGTYDLFTNNFGPTDQERVLSATMQKAWADFAKNPTLGPGWATTPSVEVFGGPGGTNSMGTFTMSSSAANIDTKCEIYRSFYDAVQG